MWQKINIILVLVLVVFSLNALNMPNLHNPIKIQHSQDITIYTEISQGLLIWQNTFHISYLNFYLHFSVWRNPKSERNRIRNFFPRPNFFDTESNTFSDTDFFPIPIPILFSIPKFYETDTNTFFDTKIFRNQYRYFFRYQFFSKPIPILFLKPNLNLFRSKFVNWIMSLL